MSNSNSYNDYAIIEIGHARWILVQVLRTATTPAAAWHALDKCRTCCVVETDQGKWAACLLSAVPADRQACLRLLIEIPKANLLFESRAPEPAFDNDVGAALQKLLASDKVRFERSHAGDESWFAT